MFGEKIDYWLLRPLAHNRNRATEEELNASAGEIKAFDPIRARLRLEKLVARFEGSFRIDPKLAYIDVGCGTGDLALAFIQAGATDVTGVDLVERKIDAARVAAKQVGGKSCPDFICADINTWQPNKRYDVVVSHHALEHISQPDKFISSLTRLLKPEGVAFLAFGPMFHSPVGDHLEGFFRIQLPWRGVLCSEKALMRLRKEFFRPGDPVDRFQDVVSGLNLMRFSEFLSYTQKAALDVRFLSINPQFKSIPPIYWISEILTRSPLVRDYFVISVYAILKRADNGQAAFQE